MKNFAFFLILFAIPTFASANINQKKIPGRLPTHLSASDIAREALDQKLYPNLMKFLASVDVSKGIYQRDPRNAAFISTPYVFTPTLAMWQGFFRAAAADHLTALRAFALLAREIKKEGVVVFGPGETFEKAVGDNVDLGLALPAQNIGTAIWSPDPNNTDPEFQLHMKIFYTKPYIHRFPDYILPANLKIGYGPEQTYWMNGQEYTQHTVDTDIYDGPVHGVGFRNVQGIGGQKRGFMGFLQKVLFFLPDAVHSMTISEVNDEMITEALVNTVVKNFEKNPIYSIKMKTE